MSETKEGNHDEQAGQVVLMSAEAFVQEKIKEYNITPEKIAEVKKHCDSLVIAGIDDKEGYEAVSKALRAAIKVRTGIEAKRKDLKEISKNYNTTVDAEAKRLTGIFAPIEADLEKKKKAIDDEKARLKEAEDLKIKRRNEERIAFLFGIGALFNGAEYQVHELFIYKPDVENMSDEAWEEIKVKANDQKNELDRVLREADENKDKATDDFNKRLKELQDREKALEEREAALIPKPVPTVGPDANKAVAIAQPQGRSVSYGGQQPRSENPPQVLEDQVSTGNPETDYYKGYDEGMIRVKAAIIVRLKDPNPINREGIIKFVESIK